MLKLITEGQTPNNPTIPIRWCIEPSDRAKLIELGADNIHVLISIAYENGAEDRQLRPLDEAMTYVSFRFAGKHTIFARLVWWSDLERMRGSLLQRTDRWRYQINVLNYDRNALLDHISWVHPKCSDLPAAEPLDVMFEKGFFAKEAPEWFNDWVNLCWTYPSVDQCQFRRRIPFALLVQPFLWLVWEIIARLIALVPLLVGAVFLARNLNPRAVLEGNPAGVWPKEWIAGNRTYGRSLWIVEDSKGNLKLYRVFVSPLFIMLCIGILMYYSSRLNMGYIEIILLAATFLVNWMWSVLLFVGPLVLVGIFLLSLVVFLILQEIKEKAAERHKFEHTPEYLEKVRLAAEEDRRRRLDEAYQYLTCPKANEIRKAATIEGLPPEHRTLRLRFYDLKRNLCRPYAR